MRRRPRSAFVFLCVFESDERGGAEKMERGATLATAQEVLFGGLFFKMFPLISFHRDILVYGLQQPQVNKHTLNS